MNEKSEVGELSVEGRVKKFEDLEVWKEGMFLATKIYKELKDCRDFGLRDQMQRSAVSIPSNISAMLHNYIKIRIEKF